MNKKLDLLKIEIEKVWSSAASKRNVLDIIKDKENKKFRVNNQNSISLLGN